MGILPAERPDIDIQKAKWIGEQFAIFMPFVLCVRGFQEYEDANLRGIYDDAIVLVDEINFETFNANLDPSEFKRGVACLVDPQVMLYKIGTHNISKEKSRQYQALVQAAPVTIKRDEGKEEAGYFGINCHRGGNNVVGSEGCMTLPPLQWPEFMSAIWATLRMRNVYTISFLLVNKQLFDTASFGG